MKWAVPSTALVFLFFCQLLFLDVSPSNASFLENTISKMISDFKKQISSPKYSNQNYHIIVPIFPVNKPNIKALGKNVKSISFRIQDIFNEELSKQFKDVGSVKQFYGDSASYKKDACVIDGKIIKLKNAIEIRASFIRFDNKQIIFHASSKVGFNHIDKAYLDEFNQEHIYTKIKQTIGRIPRNIDKTNIKISRIEGVDKDGYEAKFDIISQQFEWPFGNYKRINPGPKGEDLTKYLLTPEIQIKLKESFDIICVGTASCENVNKKWEEDRAERRSIQLCKWVQDAFTPQNINQQLYTLNIGLNLDKTSWRSNNTSLTSYQRWALIIGVVEKHESINLNEAIRNALEKNFISRFNINNYSLSSENKFRLKKLASN